MRGNLIALVPSNPGGGHMGQPSDRSSGSGSSSSSVNAAWSGPLPPQLAQLQWLEGLALIRHGGALGAMPPQWGLPSAFPRLKQLFVTCLGMGGPLPDIHPGALPHLGSLFLDTPALRSTLPASWGSSRTTLPSLKTLSLQLDVEGALPAAWGSDGGLEALEQLLIDGRKPAAAAAAGAAAPPKAASRGLHASWGSTRRFPCLLLLQLSNLDLTGSIPPAWLQGVAFPAINLLELSSNTLTGTLPPQLFTQHPRLRRLVLQGNRFNGSLPSAWGASRAHDVLLAGNDLTGPAFPPAWLQPGAWPELEVLDVSGNAGLTGSLPPILSWPLIETLVVAGTGLSGSVPASLCALFAHRLQGLHINQTSIDPALPPCPNSTIAGASLLDVQSPGAGSHAAGVMPRACARSAALAGRLAALLSLVAVAAAGAALTMMWRHRRPQRHTHTLLQGCGRHAADDGNEAAAARDGFVRQCPGGRMEALVQAELRSSGRRGIELCHVAALPATLARQLGAASQSARSPNGTAPASKESSWPPAGIPHAVEEEQRQQQQQQAKLVPGGGRDDIAAAGGLSICTSSSIATSQHHSCQWGLPTDSLRLLPQELQFVADSDGWLVELGRGSHAVVYLASLTGVQVAVKVYEMREGTDSGLMWREVALLRQCMHARIVPLFGVAVQGPLLMVAMDLMQGGSLRSLLLQPHRRQELQWRARGRQVAVDVAVALAPSHQAARHAQRHQICQRAAVRRLASLHRWPGHCAVAGRQRPAGAGVQPHRGSPRAAVGAAVHAGCRHVLLWHAAGGAHHTAAGAKAGRVGPATCPAGLSTGGGEADLGLPARGPAA